MSIQIFQQQFINMGREWIEQTLKGAVHAPTADWMQWTLDDQPMGWVQSERAQQIAQFLPHCTFNSKGLNWSPGTINKEQRNLMFAQAGLQWKSQGWVHGWRDEFFDLLDQNNTCILSAERSLFQFAGMPSQAVHINGYHVNGKMWCARRSPNKATHPHMWDNLSAGGLPTGEDIFDAAARELGEEAGIEVGLAQNIFLCGSVLTSRAEANGWHQELLWIFDLLIPANIKPHNTDGEVCEFACLNANDLYKQLQSGEFTPDAMVAIAKSHEKQLHKKNK
jgi:8-oxo-dGTP pyrophosphatase MutT (NUDIX family)